LKKTRRLLPKDRPAVCLSCPVFLPSGGGAFHGDVVLSKFIPGNAFDSGADISCSLVHEGVHIALLDLDDAHDVVPFDGDFVCGKVVNDDLAVLVTVDADQRGYSCQRWCSWAVNRGHVGLVRVHFSIEFGCDDA